MERGRKGLWRPRIAHAKVLGQMRACRGQGQVKGCGWSKEWRKADLEKVKRSEGDRTLGLVVGVWEDLEQRRCDRKCGYTRRCSCRAGSRQAGGGAGSEHQESR